MKKFSIILSLVIGLGILAFLIFLGWDMRQEINTPRPEWVDIGASKMRIELNIPSITKIQEETVTENIRINSPAFLKRNIYAAWIKVYFLDDDEVKKALEQSGKKVKYLMMRVFVDLINHESYMSGGTTYYKDGSFDTLPGSFGWEGVTPGTNGEDIFEAIVEYK